MPRLELSPGTVNIGRSRRSKRLVEGTVSSLQTATVALDDRNSLEVLYSLSSTCAQPAAPVSV